MYFIVTEKQMKRFFIDAFSKLSGAQALSPGFFIRGRRSLISATVKSR